MYPLPVTIHSSAEALGTVAGARAASSIRAALDARGAARVMLAAAPSQSPTLAALAAADLDFSRVEFFHMDDYLGLPRDASQAFGAWLCREFIDLLPGSVTFHRIDTLLPPGEAAAAYGRVLGAEPFDVTLCGLGVNAHLAFNDPPADFAEAEPVRVVNLDDVSRRQQVDEGHFAGIDAVPQRALTVTIPRLLRARHVICSVLGRAKHDAVRRTLEQDPNPEVPGTALKLHPHAELHVDAEAMSDE